MLNDLILMKFSAPWCAPCKAMVPVLKKVLVEHENINLIDINIDDDSDKAAEYNIRSIPTLILFKNGQDIGRLVGGVSADQIKELLSS